MNQTRWRQINELFHAAIERSAEEREILFKITAETDPDLAREVQSLLEKHNPAQKFLDVPAWAVAAELMFDEAESLVGKQIGRYKVLEEIGRGGMGVVYAVHDEQLKRTVALKALFPEYVSDEKHRERLKREAQLAAGLESEAIARIYNLEEIDGAVYIAVELVRGETLREELAAGPVKPDRLLNTLIEITSGLAAAHSKDVIHRDLKPENIVRRRRDGHIKILDFGIARIIDPATPTITRLTSEGTVAGTPGYMAPEQLGGGQGDARADVYAFGVLAWELSTGERPPASNPLAMETRILEASPTTLRCQLSIPDLEPIIRRCLRIKLDERYPSAQPLLEDLQRIKDRPSDLHPRTVAVMDDVSGLWWWKLHQRVVYVIDASTPILVAVTYASLNRPYRIWLLLSVLALATVAVAYRLNLMFMARVYPARLPSHRTKAFPMIAAAETALAFLILLTAALIGEAREGLAAILVILASLMVASLALIEPATTGAAGLTREREKGKGKAR